MTDFKPWKLRDPIREPEHPWPPDPADVGAVCKVGLPPQALGDVIPVTFAHLHVLHKAHEGDPSLPAVVLDNL